MPNHENCSVHVGKAIRIVLMDLGLDAHALLRRLGLPWGLLDGQGSKISIDVYYQLLDAMTAEVDDPLLALKLGDASGIDYFDPAFFAAMCSPNMCVAATRLSEYKRLVSPFFLDVQIDQDLVNIAFGCSAMPCVQPTMALTEIVFLVNFVRRATRRRIVPLRVTMPFDVPDPAAFQAHFGCAVHRDTSASMSLSRPDAMHPFVTHDDQMWRFFEPQLRRQMEEGKVQATTRKRVAHCLVELLPNGRANIEEVARELAMSKRTLQRRLADEGTTWLEVLNDARETLAKHYLVATELGTAEVSFLLGFEDPTSLFRAFKRWENTSPELWRAQNIVLGANKDDVIMR